MKSKPCDPPDYSIVNCPDSVTLKCFRTAYGLKRRDVTLACFEDRTMQGFKAECDINTIMAQYQATGIVDHQNQLPAQWGEVPTLTFHEAMSLVIEARAKFDALPSNVRERFNNNPGAMMEFLRNPENREEGEKLGLLRKAEVAPTAPAAAPSVPPGGTVS